MKPSKQTNNVAWNSLFFYVLGFTFTSYMLQRKVTLCISYSYFFLFLINEKHQLNRNLYNSARKLEKTVATLHKIP